MLLSIGVFRGGYGGSYPSWIREIYAFWGIWPPPPKKKNVNPSWEKKLNTPLFFKTLSSSHF